MVTERSLMTIPLILLALGALFSGYIGYDLFVGKSMQVFWDQAIFVLPTNTAIIDAHQVPLWVKVAPVIVGLFGIGLAYYMYIVRTDLPAKVVARFGKLYLFFYNKWYFDELYDRLFVRPA